MSTVANAIIDALGGSTAVSRIVKTPLSTVHSWRKNGIPPARLDHLRLAAAAREIPVDVDAIAAAVALCSSCERADVEACTEVDCPMRAREEQKAAA
jgi:hypothetical protein